MEEVPIHFQSLRSSSAGNCLALWTPTSSILIDCGIGTQRECREVLQAHTRQCGSLDGVVVSHAHGDHMSHSALRVLAREGVPIGVEGRVAGQLRDRHSPGDWSHGPRLRLFPDGAFELGDFHVLPIEVPHAPGYPTFGFVITAGSGRARRKAVICTDLNDCAPILHHMADADFVFIEANHDLDLLRQRPNPNSRFHLNNVQTTKLLCHAAHRISSPPHAVMLGHLSEERNTRRLAIDEVRRGFAGQRSCVPFDLDAAPARGPSAVVEV